MCVPVGGEVGEQKCSCWYFRSTGLKTDGTEAKVAAPGPAHLSLSGVLISQATAALAGRSIGLKNRRDLMEIPLGISCF